MCVLTPGHEESQLSPADNSLSTKIHWDCEELGDALQNSTKVFNYNTPDFYHMKPRCESFQTSEEGKEKESGLQKIWTADEKQAFLNTENLTR